MYDSTCKFIAAEYSRQIAVWLLGRSLELTEIEPSELSLEPIRADSVIFLESEDLILHIEFQTDPKDDIPFRMLDYAVRIYRRYEGKDIYQVVIYLRKSSSPLVTQDYYQRGRTRHKFDIIRLWETPSDQLLQNPGLFPFAILSQTDNRENLLRQIGQQIQEISDRREQSNVSAGASRFCKNINQHNDNPMVSAPLKKANVQNWDAPVSASTAILAGLLLDKKIIKRLLREDIMKESVIYQEIESSALERGRQEGRQKGEATLILRLLNRRIGKLSPQLSQRIQGLSVEELENLGEALLDFQAENDLLNWLENN